MGEKKWVRWLRSWERGALCGWLFSLSFFFSLRSLLWVCVMWRCVIGLWSHQSCANRLAGKLVSLRGCWGECVCCANHRCGTVWETVWRSKTYINGEQVGQLTLSQTNLLSRARWECLELRSLCAVTHVHWIQTHSSIHKFSMLHLHSVNYIMFALDSYIPEVQCGLRTLKDTNLGFFHKALLYCSDGTTAHTEQMLIVWSA